MKRTLLICIILITCLSDNLYAQITLSGFVTDIDNKAVSGAVVMAMNSGNVIGATTTQSDGKFVVNTSAADSIVLNISHLQFEDYSIGVKTGGSNNLNVGQIVLYEKNYSLDEVVVTADFIKRKGANTIVSVKNNPQAKNKNTLQFITNLPGVNGLSINGNGVSKVYVNNRELKLSPSELYRYLAGLKAEDVSTIQLLPKGGAKYAADHKGGIIHIHLKSGGKENLSGSVSLPVTVNLYDGALSASVPLSVNYTNNKVSSYTYLNGSYLQNERTDNNYSIGENVEQNYKERGYKSLILDQSVVIDVDKNNSVGVALTGWVKPDEHGKVKSGISDIDDKIALYRGGGTLNYKHLFNGRGSNIEFAGDYLYNYDKRSNLYRTGGGDADNNNSVTKKNTGSFKLDGVFVMGDGESSVGYGLFYLGLGARQNYDKNGVSNLFKYNENIYGAYAEFYKPLFDYLLDLNVGLRYEGAAMDWSFAGEDADRKNGDDLFNDIFPSASLTFNSPNGKFYSTLSYERSVSRPIMADYNPVVYRDGDNIFSTGAAHLLPQFENVLSLTNNINRNHTLSLSYIWQKDIYDVVYHREDDKIYISSDNIGSSDKIQLYADTRYSIIKKWLTMRVSGTFDYTKYRHSVYGVTNSYNATLSAMLRLDMPESWIVMLSGNYTAPQIVPTVRFSDFWGLNAILRKVFSNRYIVSLSAANILYNSNAETKSRIKDVPYINCSNNHFRTITLSFTYNFGSSKLKYVKRAKSNGQVKERSSSK